MRLWNLNADVPGCIKIVHLIVLYDDRLLFSYDKSEFFSFFSQQREISVWFLFLRNIAFARITQEQFAGWNKSEYLSTFWKSIK